MSTLIITMAGESRRFREAGHTQPKYRLSVHDRTLFSWSIESLRNFIEAGWKLCFVGRAADESLEAFIQQELRAFKAPSFALVQLEHPTDGQASTAMQAAPFVDASESCAIYNIDTYVDPQHLQAKNFTGDGWIPCFPGDGDGWSFVVVDKSGNVSEVREKVRVSPHCTVGFYGFGSFQLFADAYTKGTSATGGAELKERYIAPLYNVLIQNGLTVKNYCLPRQAVTPLGTPVEVDAFATSSL